MKTIQLFSIFALLFLTAFTTNVPSSIEIQCEKELCGCDASLGSISGIYQETKQKENGYPVYLGPNKKKSYQIRLKAETPKGADFTVYRWEIRTSGDELVYFDKNIKTTAFPFSETKGSWTAEDTAYEPVPNKVAKRL